MPDGEKESMKTYMILKYGSAEEVFKTWLLNPDKFTEEEKAFVATNTELFSRNLYNVG